MSPSIQSPIALTNTVLFSLVKGMEQITAILTHLLFSSLVHQAIQNMFFKNKFHFWEKKKIIRCQM